MASGMESQPNGILGFDNKPVTLKMTCFSQEKIHFWAFRAVFTASDDLAVRVRTLMLNMAVFWKFSLLLIRVVYL